MKPARVLLADDHAVVRAGIRNALESMDEITIVGEVGDGIALHEALKALQPDCVLIDVTMPHFEPISEIRGIRQNYPVLRILVVSAYDDDVYVQGLLSAGVNGYHLKDQSLLDLRLAVQRVLAGERWISSPLLDKLLRPQQFAVAEPTLSRRQREILHLLEQGFDNRSIAQQLGVSIKTIENHLTRLYRQLGVQSRLEAAHYVREHPDIVADGRNPTTTPSIMAPAVSHVVSTSILVVDDNGRYRSQIRRIIARSAPHAIVIEAQNTAEAILIVRQHPPGIAFVDVVLGDEDGIRCTSRIKELSAATRVILMSAYPDREFRRRGMQAGATVFVDKKDLDAAAIRQIVEDSVI